MSSTKTRYTDRHAASGVDAKLPGLETWPSQYTALKTWSCRDG
jgi:hypothetical protein